MHLMTINKRTPGRSRLLLAINFRMRGPADSHLEVRGDDVIVDLPGTSYTITYNKRSSLLSFSSLEERGLNELVLSMPKIRPRS
jgi:hypothetical protein